VIIATVPLPPSANELFANRRSGGGRVKTKAYKAWLEEAGWHLKRAWSGLGRPEFPEQPMRLEITVGLSGRHRDLSNCCKAIEDAMVKTLPVPDDRWNDVVLLQRGQVPDGLARIRLEPIAPS
jgi:Holliday junction resolvase RusA-like endonuclease